MKTLRWLALLGSMFSLLLGIVAVGLPTRRVVAAAFQTATVTQTATTATAA